MSWCETEMQKNMPLVEQNVMKFEVFILGQRINQKRNKGWWRGSRERIEMEAQKVRGHVQTIFGKINVIMTLRGGG